MGDAIFASTFSLPGEADTTSSTMRALDTAGILLSLGINLVATLCIAFKAWYRNFDSLVFTCSLQVCRAHRRTLRLAFSDGAAKRTPVNELLTLMVECGLILCVAQVTSARTMSVQSKRALHRWFVLSFILSLFPTLP